MKILVVEPMKPCEVREIPDTLEAMQALVGGYIQAVYPFQEEVAVICNEKGRNLDLPYNRPLMDESGLPYDIVCGTFFMAGVSGEHFVSLTDEQIQRYLAFRDTLKMLREMDREQERPPVPQTPALPPDPKKARKDRYAR